MAFHVFNDPTQGTALVIFVIVVPLCAISVAMRFVASRRTIGKAGREDWLALGAYICLLAFIIADIPAFYYFDGQNDLATLPLDHIVGGLKCIYAATFFFPLNQLCAKASILLLYHRIFGINRLYARWIIAFGVLQVMHAIAVILTSWLQCNPVYKYWDVLETKGSCITVGPYLATAETANCVIDFAMAILAVIMLGELQMSKKTKFKLAVVFLLGALSGVFGIIKIGFAFDVNVHYQVLMGLWATIQMSLSVICCCAITYRPLFKGSGVFSRLVSKLTSPTTKSQDSSSRGTGRVDTDRDSRWIKGLMAKISGKGRLQARSPLPYSYDEYQMFEKEEAPQYVGNSNVSTRTLEISRFVSPMSNVESKGVSTFCVAA